MPNNIKEIREQKGITQTKLAASLNMNRQHLNRIENGKAELPFILAARIANILDCRLEDIFLK